MIITIREPTEVEMREYLLRCGWREDKSAARVRGDKFWIACNQTEKHSLDIYSAFIEAARTAMERAVFLSTAATPLSDAERGLGEENVVQKTVMPLPNPKQRKRREVVASSGGGLF